MSAALRPDSDALRFAAEWLRQYDDTHDGGADTARAAAVADWLDEQANAADVREAARKHGVPTKLMRKAIAKAAGRAA
jgi:GNAT superfamily N-acetyltransferase